MALAFYMAFIPHLGYPYPLHLDEWTHLAYSNQIINGGGVFDLTDPFYGGAPIFNQFYEVGFHLFWAIFHQISGILWIEIFRYFPIIIFMFTVLSVYILAKRQGFGWELLSLSVWYQPRWESLALVSLFQWLWDCSLSRYLSLSPLISEAGGLMRCCLSLYAS